MANGPSPREAIRDDRYYTALLLGQRASPLTSSASPPSSICAVSGLPAPRRASTAAVSSNAVSPLHAFWSRNTGTDNVPTHTSGTSIAVGSEDNARLASVRREDSAGDEKAGDGESPSEENADEHVPARKRKRKELMVASGEPLVVEGHAEKGVVVSSNSQGEGEHQLAVGKNKTKRRYRKATHTLRKEEKERLLQELTALRAQLVALKNKAMASCGQPEQDDHERFIACKVLREAVQGQQLQFANVQGIMSEYALCNFQAGSPIQRAIHLVMDEQRRRETLWALKPKKLHEADQFLRQRRPHIDPCKPMCEDHRYELANGDFCSTRFTAIQFHGVESVQQIFDMLVLYFCNIEITVSEKLGTITIREDDDSGDKGVTQNRLVSTTTNGMLMESNTVLFSHFYEPDNQPGHERGRGLIVADFVDEDERHPYRPDERIRRDINTILELTSYTRRVPTLGDEMQDNGSDQDHEEVVVVLTRWVYSQMHRPNFPVPSRYWEELRDNMDRWGETMHRSMVESLTPVQ